MIDADLRSWVLARPEIAGKIGTRCYPMRLPQDAILPALTYQTIAGSESITHSGGANLGRKRIQFDCWAVRYEDALALADAIRGAFSGVLTPMGGTVSVAGRIINDMDVPEPEPALWRRMIEVGLWHTEEV